MNCKREKMQEWKRSQRNQIPTNNLFFSDHEIFYPTNINDPTVMALVLWHSRKLIELCSEVSFLGLYQVFNDLSCWNKGELSRIDRFSNSVWGNISKQFVLDRDGFKEAVQWWYNFAPVYFALYIVHLVGLAGANDWFWKMLITSALEMIYHWDILKVKSHWHFQRHLHQSKFLLHFAVI